MIADAVLSYLHFIFALLLAGTLRAEAFVLRLPVDGRVARLLLRIDMFYAIAAVGVIVAGISRVAWGVKGWDFMPVSPFSGPRWPPSPSSALSRSARRGRTSPGTKKRANIPAPSPTKRRQARAALG